jgi:hypothetical protein
MVPRYVAISKNIFQGHTKKPLCVCYVIVGREFLQ